MTKKIEVKVGYTTIKSKRQLLKAVCKVKGIDQVSMDVEKGVLTMIGDVDPLLVITRVRNIRNVAEIISVGAPRTPDPPKSPPKSLPPPCFDCDCNIVGVSFESLPYNGGMCTIL